VIAWLRQPHVKRRFSIAFNWISIIGTLVTIWWFVRNLNIHQLGDAFGRITLGPLVVAVILGLISQANRALGWTVMLNPTYPVPYGRQLRYELTAQAASVLMPARAGELLRVWLLRREDVPAATTVALIAVKKLFEGLGLAALSLLAPPLLTGLPGWLTSSIWVFAGAMAALTVGLIIGARRMRSEYADSRWGRFVSGLEFLRDNRRLLSALGLAMLGEVLDWAAVVASLYALDIHLALPAAAVILFMVDTSNLFPSGPAHAGTFEVGVLAAFDAVHGPTSAAVAFAVVFHTQQVLSQLVVGVPLLLQEQTGRRRSPEHSTS
jgi:uncharacterized membrane protein YbhN (UPF0104 family)